VFWCAGGGVTPGSPVSNPSVFFVNKLVAMIAIKSI